MLHTRTIVLAATGVLLVGAGTVTAVKGEPVEHYAPPRRATLAADAQPSTMIAEQLRDGILPLRGHLGRAHITRQDVAAARTLASTQASPAPADTSVSGRQLRTAYGVTAANRAGWTGRGVTVLLPIWHGSPAEVLRRDLGVFSRANGVPPADLEFHATGPITPMPEPEEEQAPWRYVIAEETTLDASMIHAMAPHAKIVSLVTPETNPADGGFAEILDAVRGYAKSHRGERMIASLSYGVYERAGGLPAETIRRLDGQLAAITAQFGVTWVVANGDTGYSSGLTPDPDVPWPASSPHVTAVGGTEVHLDAAGRRTAPDTVWTDADGDGTATGGGLSSIFSRPAYQDRYASVVGDRRADNDIAANGSTASRVEIYSTYNVLGGVIDDDGGWRKAAGTSEAAPLVAGMLALVSQAARRPLGNVNPALYWSGRTAVQRRAAGLADVTQGCNAVAGNPGFCGAVGWDPVTGNGTIGTAVRLVATLAVFSRSANR